MGKEKPQIILFGDSITEFSFQLKTAGWGAALADYYARKADVVMRGFGGYNSRLALYLLDSIFPIEPRQEGRKQESHQSDHDQAYIKSVWKHSVLGESTKLEELLVEVLDIVKLAGQTLLPSPNKPLLVTVFFGANDASIRDLAHGLLHVPLAEYGENLKKIVAHLKKISDSTFVVLITPPPIDEKALITTCATVWMTPTNGVPPRSNEIAKLYADECVKVAQETGVSVINLWSAIMETPDWTKCLCDGLHLSAQGNAKVFEELLKVVKEPSLVPTLKADQMPYDFIPFTEFGTDPVASLRKCIANL